MTTQATSEATDTKAADTKAADTKQADTSTTTTDSKATDTKDADKSTTSSNADDKGADTTKADDKKADEKATSKAPEKYDLKLGENSLLDQRGIDKIAAIAREQGLSNEQAQELVTQTEQAASDERESNIKAWESEINADKELGGNNLAATKANIARFATRFAPKDSPVAKLLHSTGYGSHPAVVRLMNDIGKALGEDRPATGSDAASGKKTVASTLYDHPSNYQSGS